MVDPLLGILEKAHVARLKESHSKASRHLYEHLSTVAGPSQATWPERTASLSRWAPPSYPGGQKTLYYVEGRESAERGSHLALNLPYLWKQPRRLWHQHSSPMRMCNNNLIYFNNWYFCTWSVTCGFYFSSHKMNSPKYKRQRRSK